MAPQKLLTKAMIKNIPMLYTTEHQPMGERMVTAKFFHPLTKFTYYVLEFDGNNTFFGICKRAGVELDYITLADLRNMRILGLIAERDLSWEPTKVKDIPELSTWLHRWEHIE